MNQIDAPVARPVLKGTRAVRRPDRVREIFLVLVVELLDAFREGVEGRVGFALHLVDGLRDVLCEGLDGGDDGALGGGCGGAEVYWWMLGGVDWGDGRGGHTEVVGESGDGVRHICFGIRRPYVP
jgi:hypothetical protein